MSVERYRQLVAQHPENELFHFSLAQVLLRENRAPEALQHLRFCTEHKADWMMPRILLGKALLGLGRKREARPWLEAALALAVGQSHETPERELRAVLAEMKL
jgi:predicted Zn-dependent protease